MAKGIVKPKVNPNEIIQKSTQDLRTLIEEFTEEWEKFYYDKVKKGAKNARKKILAIKKQAAMIRSAFRDIEGL